jgi:hypothetical protein
MEKDKYLANESDLAMALMLDTGERMTRQNSEQSSPSSRERDEIGRSLSQNGFRVIGVSGSQAILRRNGEDIAIQISDLNAMLEEVADAEAAASKANGEAATTIADAVREVVADRVGDLRVPDAEAAVSGSGSEAAMLQKSCAHKPVNCIRRIDWIERNRVTPGEVIALKEELKVLIGSRETLMSTALFTDFGVEISPNDLKSIPSPEFVTQTIADWGIQVVADAATNGKYHNHGNCVEFELMETGRTIIFTSA